MTDHTLDQTSLATVSLLEARLLRIEHILYGPSAPPTEPPAESATTSLAELERRFSQLLRHFRVYAEILKICTSTSTIPASRIRTDTSNPIAPDQAQPTLFQSPSSPSLTAPPSSATPDAPPTIPTQLPPEAVRATVLAYASSFPSTASALTAATTDTPIPDAQQSAALAALAPRMRAVEALQRAQAVELGALRQRSEHVLRAWYEGGVLRYGDALADLEGRLEKVERGVRRVGRAKAEEVKV